MLSRLEGFVAIAEHGQLGRAAAALHLTQPSLTARLQRLEAELGTPLYRRTRRGMLLTPHGEALLPHARRALEAVADGRRALSGDAPLPGRLALGAAPAVSTYVLPALLERLRRDYPSIALSVRTGRSEEVLEMVLAGEAQIGLVRALRHPAIEATPFYQEELVLACAPGPPARDRRRGADRAARRRGARPVRPQLELPRADGRALPRGRCRAARCHAARQHRCREADGAPRTRRRAAAPHRRGGRARRRRARRGDDRRRARGAPADRRDPAPWRRAAGTARGRVPRGAARCRAAGPGSANAKMRP